MPFFEAYENQSPLNLCDTLITHVVYEPHSTEYNYYTSVSEKSTILDIDIYVQAIYTDEYKKIL